MRLKQIKLAGFKSFVDPTTVTLPGNRCSIVGPNGGGKSNIVDAVRWVIGESSAKQLRGENLSDVIFKGCDTRALASVASVELIFDNSDGRIGGEYAAYAEIAIRRQVGRDSQSTYFLNGTRCRRRDIADVFLGTGFGPRSYSVIAQGTIGQFVEARPEDIRLYLEEAAGLSKYRERRRETENRIRHTRANLERLRDTREELGRTLDRLRKQAKAAERYRELKQEESLRTAELHAIGYRNLSQRLTVLRDELRRREVELERLRAEQQSVDTDIAAARVRQEEVDAESHAEQASYYRLGEDIARIEETIQFSRARVKESEQELDGLLEQATEAARQLAMDDAEIEKLQGAIGDLTPRLEAAARRDKEAAARLLEVEQVHAEWQEAWDELGRQVADSTRSAQVQASRIEHFEQVIANLGGRLEQLAQDEQAPSPVESGQVDGLATEIVALQERRAALDSDVDRCLAELLAAREDIPIREAGLDEARQHLQSLRLEFANLHAVQQAALGRADDTLRDWLAAQGLDAAARVGETLSVAPGWEHAVEMVLGEFLQGLRVDDADRYVNALPALCGGHLALLEARIDAAPGGDLPSLVSLIRSSDMKLGSVLHGVYAAESDRVALRERTGLNPGESIVTRSGLWVGPDWLRKLPESAADPGIIQRAQELEALDERVEEAKLGLSEQRGGLDAARERLRALGEERELLQGRADEVYQALAELKADHGVQQARLEAADAHRGRLRRDRRELERQIALAGVSLAEAQGELAAAERAAERCAPERQSLADAKGRLQEELEQARQAARARRDDYHAINVQRQSHASHLQATQTARQRQAERAEQLDRDRLSLQQKIEQSKVPLPGLQTELTTKLALQHEAEARQREVRARLDELGAHIRELIVARDEAAARIDQVRGDLESVRLQDRELSVQQANAREQVHAAGYDLASVLNDLPGDADEEVWKEQLERLDRRIRQLGPINLAAIEEYDVEAERKAWLDAQHDDLERALDTLQAAIRKIDAETRARFKDTFEAVNAHLQKLFPKLFGGGHAYLALTGDNLLDTGVSIMARPPGKRNAGVYLLSGGEKALAAVALVFAIFQLNPSPVCVLDEVDAALDDNNVLGVAELIRELSGGVQFIVITHNKLTMEMADHLIGVTMTEPGVSRLVSVDIEEAAALAAS